MMPHPTPDKYKVQLKGFQSPSCFMNQNMSSKPSDLSLDFGGSPCFRLGKTTLIFEFKIDGMTCVACSRTIENAMQKQYEGCGLI